MLICKNCGLKFKGRLNQKFCSRKCFGLNKATISIEKKCPCGNKFMVKNYLIHRKKYCSKKCKYKYQVRKSGLKHKIVSENKGWFVKGNMP